MSVTIREVAREASVSVATVSRVLNGKGPARPETERRIRRAAKLLRYIPHGGARSLITRKTSTLGVLLPELYGEFFSELIRGIDVCARRKGYHLLVSSSHSDRAETEEMVRAMRGRVDGLIVLSPDVRPNALKANLPEKFPVVLVNTAGGRGAFDSLTVDNFGGAFEMVRHLARLGHRRIAFVQGPSANRDASERLRGYREGGDLGSVLPYCYSARSTQLSYCFGGSGAQDAVRGHPLLEPSQPSDHHRSVASEVFCRRRH